MASPQPVELALPGESSSVPAARELVRTTLLAWGRADAVEAVSTVVSELATNAVLHARSGFTVRLSCDSELRLEVSDSSSSLPTRKRASRSATTGRGMALVEQLSDEWGVVQTAHGKVVWVRWA